MCAGWWCLRVGSGDLWCQPVIISSPAPAAAIMRPWVSLCNYRLVTSHHHQPRRAACIKLKITHSKSYRESWMGGPWSFWAIKNIFPSQVLETSIFDCCGIILSKFSFVTVPFMTNIEQNMREDPLTLFVTALINTIWKYLREANWGSPLQGTKMVCWKF